MIRTRKSLFQCYDHLAVKGGAERVAMILQDYFTEMELIVGGINRDKFDHDDSLDRVTELVSYTEHPLIRMMKQVAGFKRYSPNIGKSDIGIYSGTFAPLMLNSEVKLNIHYCHTIPRFAYDLLEFYRDTMPFYKQLLFDTYVAIIRNQYEMAIKSMDIQLCNSKNTQKRIKKYCNIDAQVVYPPVETHRFFNRKQNGFYLSVARLESFKRVSLIVEAFKKMPDKQLVVLSGGPDEQYLRQMAESSSNIHFYSWVSDQQLLRFLSECIATIYVPIDEDFGLSPVESMAAGKPVLGVKSGGVMETVLDGYTGFLYPAELTAEHIIEGVSLLTPQKALAMRSNCIERASRFDVKNYLSQMRKYMQV